MIIVVSGLLLPGRYRLQAAADAMFGATMYPAINRHLCTGNK